MIATLQAWLDSPDVAIIGTGLLVGVAAALLGPFLVLRRNAMLSDAISHSIVFGIVVVWLFTGLASGPVQIAGAALAGVLTVWLTEALARTGRVKDDAAIGLVFPFLFSVGVLLLNLYARNVHIDTHTVLLGEIGFVWLETVAVGPVQVPKAMLWMGAVTVANALFIGLLWKELKLATFDPMLAEAFGFRPRTLFYALLALLSATAVAAFDAVGAVLFIAFAIVPPATAYLLTDRLAGMIWIGIAVAVLSAFAGYGAAIALDVSIGGMMAVTTGVCLAGAVFFGPRYGLIAGLGRRIRAARENEIRALVVHLSTHEDSEDRAEENVAGALRTHLGWPEARARDTLARAVAEGVVLREGRALHLTEKGRTAARALLEPWARA
ncbi:MAG: metal ABC transporter permease [Paracoccaceae bacterium]